MRSMWPSQADVLCVPGSYESRQAARVPVPQISLTQTSCSSWTHGPKDLLVRRFRHPYSLSSQRGVTHNSQAHERNT